MLRRVCILSLIDQNDYCSEGPRSITLDGSIGLHFQINVMGRLPVCSLGILS